MLTWKTKVSTVITCHKGLGVGDASLEGWGDTGREVSFFFFFVMESSRCSNSCIRKVVWTILQNNIL